MSMKVQRGLVLLAGALIAMLIGLTNTMNDGPAVIAQMAGAVMVIGGSLGLALIAWGLLRD